MPAQILSDQTPDTQMLVMVGVPTFGTISMYWHLQTHDMLRMGKPMNRGIVERVMKGHRVDAARNALVDEALTLKGPTGATVSHVFFLDDDVLVTQDTLIRLLSWDLPIVSGLYFAKTRVPQPLLFRKKNHGPATSFGPDERIACYGHGMGCTLIKREVFEAVEPPWFKTEEGRTEGQQFITHTEDTYFLEKAAAAGFSACVDTGCLALHYDRMKDQGYPVSVWQKYRDDEPFTTEDALEEMAPHVQSA